MNTKINIKETFGYQLQTLWQDNFNKDFLKDYRISPDFPEIAVKNSLLFIGLNPSYRKKDKDNHATENFQNIRFFNHLDSKLDPYYKPFSQISENLELSWSYLDLLFIRKTDQKEVEKFCYQCEESSSFVFNKLVIIKGIIEAIDPKVIIVTNAFSRKLLGFEKKGKNDVWMGLDFKWDDNLGTYKWKGIPVFFSGMISGQRALDKGSLERLIWHIKFVSKNQET